ncbi:hypothetical protein GCM10027027_18730 [Neomicrococcus lactis]
MGITPTSMLDFSRPAAAPEAAEDGAPEVDEPDGDPLPHAVSVKSATAANADASFFMEIPL